MELVFATNNKHKLEEISHIIGSQFKIVNLKETGIFEDIPETAETLEGNAFQKADYVFRKTGKDCFADDTGLEIEALENRPGVYSARYAGEGCTFDDNVNKILRELGDIENRKARFRTVIALIIGGTTHYFEGVVEGKIIKDKRGKEGFGYDPVFVPDGYNETFAEMPLELKNKISHRYFATKKLADFLQSITLT
jgi:XTP/dITP diphosphohydrolase